MATTAKKRIGFWERLAQILGFARQGEKLAFSLKGDFLSPTEMSFYQELKSVVGSSVTICPKVRLADLFSPNPGKDWQSNFNRISQKHADFTLCDTAAMKLLLAIELDDKSHQRADRKVRDELVDRIFADTGLPLLHFPAKSKYKASEIAAELAPHMRTTQPVPTAAPSQTMSQRSVSSAEPCCPKCGKPMIIRTGKTGDQFYGCTGFPQCRTTLTIAEAIALQQK